MSFDAERYREDSLRAWEAAAPGWVRHAARIDAWAAPVAHWLVEAISWRVQSSGPRPTVEVLYNAALNFAICLLTLGGDGVDLINEDDGRRVLLCFLKSFAQVGLRFTSHL